ncbi:hypothetical protein, partial [Aeromonas dhakensis]|uniref:hypothetical protein n=1 Tax=Aeromonas dhakensis TaxID=196024 RepID=UPI002B464E34
VSMMEVLMVMTYFQISLPTHNWDSALFLTAGLTAGPTTGSAVGREPATPIETMSCIPWNSCAQVNSAALATSNSPKT